MLDCPLVVLLYLLLLEVKKPLYLILVPPAVTVAVYLVFEKFLSIRFRWVCWEAFSDMEWGLLFHSLGNVLHPSVLAAIFMAAYDGNHRRSPARPHRYDGRGAARAVHLRPTRDRKPGHAPSGLYCGGMYGGSISAILIRTPGTPAAAATVIEGYPLGQQGHAGRALTMALFSSFSGGIIRRSPHDLLVSSHFRNGARVQLRRVFLARRVRPLGHHLDLRRLGGKGSHLRILRAASSRPFGFDPISGYPRFTFGIVEMLEGPAFIPSLIGLFALSEFFAGV